MEYFDGLLNGTSNGREEIDECMELEPPTLEEVRDCKSPEEE
jgi:hypothetical protein